MGKIEYFEIHLEKSNPVYIAGELLTGRLVLKVTERLKCNSVKITVNGMGKVQWFLDRILIFFYLYS